MRESAEAKGRRYVAEGRLQVLRVEGPEVRATCRGRGAVYELGCRDGSWFCTCPAVRTCAHLVALWLVVAVPDDARATTSTRLRGL